MPFSLLKKWFRMLNAVERLYEVNLINNPLVEMSVTGV